LVVALIGLHAPAGVGAAPQTPPTFDAGRAAALARDIAAIGDRTPGTATAALATDLVRQAFSDAGAPARTDTFAGALRDGTPARLVNLVAILPGTSSETIVLLAHRDDIPPGPGLVDSAVGTATVVEMARAFANQAHARTLLFASVDGGVSGDLGARRLLARFPRHLTPFTVLDLAAIAGPGDLLPVADAGDRGARGHAGLVAALQQMLAAIPGTGRVIRPGLSRQLLDLTFPKSAPGGQAPFVDHGVPAMQIGADTGEPGGTRISGSRLAANGQAINELVLALDAGAPPDGPHGSYLVLGKQVVSGWVIALLAVTLLVSPALVAVHLLSGASRNGAALRPELLRWGQLALPGAGLVAGVLLAGAVGAVPADPWWPPFPPTGSRVGVGALILAAFGVATAVAVLRMYPRPGAAGRDPADGLAVSIGTAIGAGTASAAIAIAAAPTAGLLLVIPLHVWFVLHRTDRGGQTARAALIWVPAVAPALAAAWAAGAGPADLARMLVDGRLPPAAALGAVGILAAAGLLTRNLLQKSTAAGYGERG
jgi:hypothetical protein